MAGRLVATVAAADTASKLTTPVKINGISFDGSADIDLNISPVLYSPIPYPQTVPPTGYLMMMGQAIAQATYPILYSLYGANLPDMRGEFIRGWDNGRGADAGRSILSRQQDAIRNITGTIGAEGLSRDIGSVEATGSFYYLGRNYPAYGGAGYWGSVVFAFDASRQVPTAADNRPRNVAFNYIVKAG